MLRLLPLLLLAACKTASVPTPAGPDVGIVTARATVSGGRSGTTSPRIVKAFFVRLEADQEDLRIAKEILPSNYTLGSRVYLFNAAPGRYALVCVVTSYEGKNHFTYLPRHVIEKSVVDVRAGEIVPIGSVRVSESRAWSSADDLQKHYHQNILSGPENPNVLQQLFPRAIDYVGEYGRLSNDPKDLERTKKDVRRSINRWGWDRWPGAPASN